jgi:PLP dependent protein
VCEYLFSLFLLSHTHTHQTIYIVENIIRFMLHRQPIRKAIRLNTKLFAMELSSSPEILHNNLRLVQQKMIEINSSGTISIFCLSNHNNSIAARLVAVSKTKPSSDINALYDIGHRHFGENYVQELLEKVSELPHDINWHFIGHVQSQKAKQLIEGVPNLFVLETLDSKKLADKLNKALQSLERAPLNVYIQVNTSAEDTKSGVAPEEVQELFLYVQENCPHLKVSGLMTIGAPNDLSCFDKLVTCRQQLCDDIGADINALDLSMGMSGDYEEAIRRGSTSVRVGSIIFGELQYPQSSQA